MENSLNDVNDRLRADLLRRAMTGILGGANVGCVTTPRTATFGCRRYRPLTFSAVKNRLPRQALECLA
ncbi:MAG: hypothetical protein ACP5QB_12655, partial [Thiomonas sp.]